VYFWGNLILTYELGIAEWLRLRLTGGREDMGQVGQYERRLAGVHDTLYVQPTQPPWSELFQST